MHNGIAAISQIALSGAAKIEASDSGNGFSFGLRICLPWVVTPKIRLCSSGSCLDPDGVRSFRPGVI